MQRLRWWLPVVLFVLGLGMADLWAHLAAVRTAPQDGAALPKPPARVQVWFSQQPSARVSRLELTGPQGAVALGELQVEPKDRSIAAAVDASLPAGRYEVNWRTAGDDGHVLRGAFSFTVTPAE